MWGKVRSGSSSQLARKTALLGCVIACGVLAGFLMMPEPEAHAATPVEVRVAGVPVDVSGDPRRAAQTLARTYLAQTITLQAADARRDVTRATLGARVDTEHLSALLAQAADARSPLRKVHAQIRGLAPLALPMPTELNDARATPLLIRLKDVSDAAAHDARIDPRARSVQPGTEGRELDVYATLERIDHALRSGDTHVEAVARALPPKLGARSYAGLDMSALLGEFETRYNRAATAQARTHNLERAASKLDGLVLPPGAIFDFNEVVGIRTAANGFKRAPEIADGELVEGVGGGTCQIASTLHAAVFFSGLPIMTRYPHSRPSYYIKLGLDATVVDGAQNFRFRNDRSYPVVLGLLVRDGRVYASVHGAQRDHSVTFIRHIAAVMPFHERISEDASLPTGTRILAQRGVPGFRLTRYRIVLDETTNIATRERSEDTYPPTAQLWRVGTGGAAPEGYVRPKNDTHPEYVADEYVQVMQTPERGTFDAVREAGRTGVYGWVEREQMVVR